jgi:hypothetical protein
MKIRKGFVSNSSSSSFIIANTTGEDKTLVDFVRENPQLIEEFKEQYSWYKDDPQMTQENLIASAEANDERIPAGSDYSYIFGDEDGTLIGRVFDYILRDGGKSASFNWYYHESLR